MDQVLKALADFYNEDPEAFELPQQNQAQPRDVSTSTS